MPQSAEEIHEQASSRADAPSLDFVEWPAFPWAAEDGRITAKELLPPTEVDRERDGEGGRPCWRCDHPDEGVVWGNERWTLSTPVGERGGSFAVEWDDLLPPVPEEVWQREVDTVAAAMRSGEQA